MYLGIIDVKALDDFILQLTFENREVRQFDMKSYLQRGIFMELQDVRQFNRVKVSFDSIEWPNGADLDPELLYDESKAVEVIDD
ncbi:MAG: DUF2442 domain-containing protein [Candidatus Margulisiibacteriota bacterium]